MPPNLPPSASEVDLGEAVRGLAAGQFVFNRYSLIKLMGRGRTSAVWQAWDDQESRDTALKFLPEMIRQHAGAMAAIKPVVAALQKISVPQVARIYGLEAEGPLAAVAQEFIAGTSLHELRAQRKNQVFDAADLKEHLKQITVALEALHAAQAAHGNLKPSNLLVTAKNQIILTDAGLDATVGYWINQLDGSPRDLSQCLRYGSPQQAKGQPPGPSDDIYSLGICLYELITSKPPFNTGNLAAQVADDAPPSMTRRRRDMRILGGLIPRAWDETVAACLAKDPEKRPENLADLVDRLELYGPSKRAAAAPDPAAIEAAIQAAIEAAPPTPQPAPAAGGPGAPAANSPPARKNLVPVIAVITGLVLGVAGWYVSTQFNNTPNLHTLNPDGDAPKTNTLDPEELERRLAAEREAMQRQFAAERAKLEAEKKLQEEEKARKEMEAKSLAALEEERKRRAEESAKMAELERKLAEAEKTRLAAEAENQRKLEEATRREAEAKRAAESQANAKRERDAQLMAQATIVGDRPAANQTWHNSLGMRMVPVNNFFMCAWETRVQDFEEFARQARFSENAWKNPGFKQAGTHPVVNVNYDDALAFCAWLTQKERAAGIIGADQTYRLPTDLEWSRAAGLSGETGATPAERSDKLTAQFPWGTAWPPPPGAGNYPDAVSFDRFDNTAPVASFMPNASGLFDLGGNAWEWCQDFGDSSHTKRVLRGGSHASYAPGLLASSFRLLVDGKARLSDNGFRIVLAR